MKKKIRISILIANYNNERFLARSIISCLKQNFKKKFEVILIDDNSTDNSLKIANKFKKDIRIFKTTKKKNILKFNTYYQLNTYYQGIIKAKGEIICFLDSDDYFKKNKLSEIDKRFSINEKTNLVFDRPFFLDVKYKYLNNNDIYSFRENIWPKFPPQSCISAKKKILIKYINLLFKRKFPMTTLDFRLAALADCNRKNSFFINKNLTIYFQHDKNESSKLFKKFSRNWFKRRNEAYLYYLLINKKKYFTLDYLVTRFVNYFFLA